MDKDLLKIIEHYGIDKQLKYIHSEYYELDEAIIEYELNESGLMDKKHITEELADVMCMLLQFKEYYHIDVYDIMRIMKEKVNRQLERIENENKKEIGNE